MFHCDQSTLFPLSSLDFVPLCVPLLLCHVVRCNAICIVAVVGSSVVFCANGVQAWPFHARRFIMWLMGRLAWRWRVLQDLQENFHVLKVAATKVR